MIGVRSIAASWQVSKPDSISSAMSVSPHFSAAIPSSGSPGISVMSTAGWRSRKAATARGAKRRARARERDEAQPAAAQARDRLQLGLGIGEPREDRVGMAHERLARVGELHAARVAVDEDGSRLTFQRRDLL